MTEDWIEQSPDTLRLAVRPMDMSKGQYIFRFGDELATVLGASSWAHAADLLENFRAAQ